MPVDSHLPNNYPDLSDNVRNDCKTDEYSFLHHEDISHSSESLTISEDSYIISQDTQNSANITNGNEFEEHSVYNHHLASVRPKVLSDDNLFHQKHKQSEFNKWRRLVGVVISGNKLRNTIVPPKFCHKLRFAQAKQKLSQLHSYFCIKIADCDQGLNIVIGVSRKDFPSASELGVNLGSVGYYSETGRILSSNDYVSTQPFYKGDIIGCGIIFPSHYKRYVDLSPDDSSDGMTDVVLSSLLNINKKSMDFVQQVLGLKLCESSDSSSDDDLFTENNRISHGAEKLESDYYNENYVESRKEVEIYFTLNMKIVGKVSTCVPIGGFYPTIQILTPGCFNLQFDDTVTL